MSCKTLSHFFTKITDNLIDDFYFKQTTQIQGQRDTKLQIQTFQTLYQDHENHLSLGASTRSLAAVVTVSKELSPETQRQSKSWEAMCHLGWNLQSCPVLYILTFKGPDEAFCIDLVKIL